MVIDNRYKTLLVDTSYLAYRTYFAVPALIPGQSSTHMVHGFLSSLVATVRKFPVNRLVTVLDKGYESKSKLYAGYKKKDDMMSSTQRADFKAQFVLLVKFLRWLGIACCYQQGYEADDVIAHLCKGGWACKDSGEKYSIEQPILLFSGDHDLYALLSTNVAMWKLRDTVYTIDDFRQEFPDMEPHQYQDMQSLMGCSSDKIPGVRGIGPKRALDLVRRYGSIAAIKTANADGDRIVKLVQTHWDMVVLSAQLVAFESVTPTVVANPPDLSKVRKYFYKLSMHALIEDWPGIEGLSYL